MKNFGTLSVKTTYKPVIYIDEETLQKAMYFVDKVKTECQWFHRVSREQDGDRIVYKLTDIYIPEQTVTGGTVDSDPELIAKLSSEIKEKTGGYNDEFNEIVSSLSCWCHSHVNMATTPSGTDDSNFKEQVRFARQGGVTGPQMMIILNKSESYFTRVLDTDLNLLFENVPIVRTIDTDYSYIDDAIAKKLTERKTTVQTPIRNPSNHNVHIGNHWASHLNLSEDDVDFKKKTQQHYRL